MASSAGATCNDSIKNGTETDIDCGGSCVADCAAGQGCAVPVDCQSRVCVGNVCQAPSCSDGIKNGGESGIDCGGPCAGCATGGPCVVATDCANLVCTGGFCAARTCSDGVKNGPEGDVDCGGPCATKCVAGQTCGATSDCNTSSGLQCVGGVCQVPAVCGNGATEGAEQCDDGNTASGDCCSSTCQYEPNGAPCTSDGLPCSIDLCNGAGACTHGASPMGTPCRPAAGDCDLAESCDGVDTICPADAKSTGACRAAAGVCDVAESCDGVGDHCPADAVASSVTVCRPPADACDAAETCDGTSVSCPADATLSDTDGDTVCDAIDNCVTIANPTQTDGDLDQRGDVCDPCTNTAPTLGSKQKLLLKKLLAPANDDQLLLKGFLDGVPNTPAIDPVANGLRLLVTDSLGATAVDVTIGAGAYDAGTKTGWQVNGAGTAWTYKGSGATTNGIEKAQLQAISSTPGRYKFNLKGKNGSYPIDPAHLPLVATIVIDTPVATSGQCGEVGFPALAPAKPSCVSAGGGATIKCQ